VSLSAGRLRPADEYHCHGKAGYTGTAQCGLTVLRVALHLTATAMGASLAGICLSDGLRARLVQTFYRGCHGWMLE